MSLGEYALVAAAGAALVYAASLLAGDGFGRGYFRRRAEYSRKFIEELDNRSKDDGSQEQEDEQERR